MARSGRNLPEINSSSMADIAFLLLIFFLVTTTIATDKGLTLTLPPKADPNQPPPDVTKNKRNIFTILVNSSDRILIEDEPLTGDITEIRMMVKEFVLNFGKMDEDAQALYNTLPQSLKALSLRNQSSSDNPKEAVVSFKADRGTSYDIYIAILDELQGAYYEIYGERIGISADDFRTLDRKKPDELEKYKLARNGIGMNISIAEPTKIGGN